LGPELPKTGQKKNQGGFPVKAKGKEEEKKQLGRGERGTCRKSKTPEKRNHQHRQNEYSLIPNREE